VVLDFESSIETMDLDADMIVNIGHSREDLILNTKII
jgi:hypothetical protein